LGWSQTICDPFVLAISEASGGSLETLAPCLETSRNGNT